VCLQTPGHGDIDTGGDERLEMEPSESDANGCLKMMWPPDGYEVKREEVEDFVVMLRVNCPGVSPALYLDWSEGPSEGQGANETGAAVGSTTGKSGMRIQVDQAPAGEAPDELLEISVYLKRGSKMWRWTVVREDGSSSQSDHHVLILPLFDPNISVSFPPKDFEFRAAVRPFFVASIFEPTDKIQTYGYPRFFYDITVRSRAGVASVPYENTYRWGRAAQREPPLNPSAEKLLPTENMIFLDFINDAPDGLYDLEIALLDGYFRRETAATIPFRLARARYLWEEEEEEERGLIWP
jgi:hypothetical protein